MCNSFGERTLYLRPVRPDPISGSSRMMRQLVYALRFTGQAAPSGTAGNVLTVATSAPSCKMSSHIGLDGLSGSIASKDGGIAIFKCEIIFTSETSFLETGTIWFGHGNWLQISTVGSGYLEASANPEIRHGAVMWRVEESEGQLAGASGLITSNFFINDDLIVTDHQFGVLMLPEW
jgi:hypothetical protein